MFRLIQSQIRQTLGQFLITDLVQYIIEPFLRSEVFVCRRFDSIDFSIDSAFFSSKFDVQTFQWYAAGPNRIELEGGGRLISGELPTDKTNLMIKNGKMYYYQHPNNLISVDLRTKCKTWWPGGRISSAPKIVFPEYGSLHQTQEYTGVRDDYYGYPQSLDRFWSQTPTVVDFEPRDFLQSGGCMCYDLVCSLTNIYIAVQYFDQKTYHDNPHAIAICDVSGRCLEHLIFGSSERLLMAASGARLFVVETKGMKSALTIVRDGMIQFVADCRERVLSVAADDWNQTIYLLYADGIEIQNFWGQRLGFRLGCFTENHSLLVNKFC